MARDVRALREAAAAATAAGKHKRALEAYLELERLEPRDAQWAKRAGETYRKLNNTKNAIDAFARSAERYAQNGFLVQAIAVCKMILQLDPDHADTLRRLAAMSEQVSGGPTRAATVLENNPSLRDTEQVAAIRRASSHSEAQLARDDDLPSWRDSPGGGAPRPPKAPTAPPPIAISRTKSKPVTLAPGDAIDHLSLRREVAESHPRHRNTPGIHVIPIDPITSIDDGELELADERSSQLDIVVDAGDAIEADLEEVSELELEDLEEIPLAAPKLIGERARRAVMATPLFAGMPGEAFEGLVGHMELVRLEPGQVLFRENDPGDALYVIVEGEVSVQNEGPPRVELSRLGPGAFLGEVALVTDQPRAATVAAIVPAELLRIDRPTLSRVLGEHGDVLRAVLRFVRDRLVERWMRTSPLFRPFDDMQRMELAARFKFLEIDAGTVLLGTGTRPDGLYIVLAGQLAVRRAQQEVVVLGPGDLIGEVALLSGGAFRSDVVARGKSLCLCLPAADFREVIMTHPHVLEYIGEQAEHSRRLEIL